MGRKISATDKAAREAQDWAWAEEQAAKAPPLTDEQFDLIFAVLAGSSRRRRSGVRTPERGVARALSDPTDGRDYPESAG